MSFGGFVGLGHSHYPIPWAALTYDTSLGGFRTNITEQQLKDAPEFSDDLWQDREAATRLAAELGRSPGAPVQQACKLKVSLRTRRHTERPAPSGIDAAQAGNPGRTRPAGSAGRYCWSTKTGNEWHSASYRNVWRIPDLSKRS